MQSNRLKQKDYPSLIIQPLDGKPVFDVMKKGAKILDGLNIKWQLGSGTLLGFVREDDGYIKHDTDLDFDVVTSLPREEIEYAFIQEGFLLCREQIYDDQPMQLAFIDITTEIVVDLCFFYEREETFINIYEHGVFLRPWWSWDSKIVYPKSSHFKRGYNIPLQVSRYLTMRYGDWETPKKYKDSGEQDAAELLIKL